MLETLIRLVHPASWRRRMRQLGGGVLALSWVWFRAVGRAEVVRAQRDARWSARRTAVRADNARREAHLRSGERRG